MRRFLPDVLLLAFDLVSGRSVPVLVAIARLPMDQALVANVLMLGALAGAFYSVYGYLPLPASHRWVAWNRFLQNSAALFCSLSLVHAIARGIHPQRGVSLSVAPCFCLVAQPFVARARDSACVISLFLAVCVLAYCLATPARGGASSLASILPALDSGDEDLEAQGVLAVLGRCLQIFVLAFYACVPQTPVPDRLAAASRYALLVNLAAALLRVAAWYCVCFYQDNVMHVILENAGVGWDWTACVGYTVLLLLSACYTAAVLREQLPSSQAARLKFTAAVLGLAVLYQQRVPDVLFYGGTALALLCLLVTAAVLEPGDGWDKAVKAALVRAHSQ